MVILVLQSCTGADNGSQCDSDPSEVMCQVFAGQQAQNIAGNLSSALTSISLNSTAWQDCASATGNFDDGDYAVLAKIGDGQAISHMALTAFTVDSQAPVLQVWQSQ